MDVASLWLPILLSAVVVWFVSTILGSPTLHHKSDFIGLPPADEDALTDAFRKLAIKPGNYLIPDFRSRAAMESEKVKQALEQGPVGHLSLWRAPITLGDKMIATLVVHIIVSALIASLAGVALPTPAPFAKVFQVVATAGILAYSFAFIPNCIWHGSYTRTIVFRIVDGIVYGLITGAIFAWRWPH